MSLSVTALSVEKSGTAILSNVGFSAPSRRITGLIGPNGAGKSTLLSALLGLLPANGHIAFEGYDLPRLNRRDRARLLALVEQSAATEERLSVRDVVALGRIPYEAAWQSEPSPEDDTIIDKALSDTGTTGFASRRFTTLSGGEQQRVHVARALAQQPRLLLLDEPTSHLDIRAQLQLLALLRQKAGAGMTILVALHDLNLAVRFCDHLVVLANGRVAAQGSPAEILTPELLRSVYGVSARLVSDTTNGRPLIVYDEAIAEGDAQIPD
jgi:iron complex transport system ATP-binding protein